jgi:hypothetical protein
MMQSQNTKQDSFGACHEFVTLHVTIGLANSEVHRGKYGKRYYAQFWIETSERCLVDFRRIL